jgi:hypothetical protein
MMPIEIPVSALVIIAALIVVAILQYVAIVRLNAENKSLRRRLAYAEADLEPVEPERHWHSDNLNREPLNPWFWDGVIEEAAE